MSTKADILTAKGEFEAHVAAHKCSPRLLAAMRGEAPCDERLNCWARLNVAAYGWGTDPADTASFQLASPQAAVL